MAHFLPIPAIDLMDGQVVRLSRGRASEKTLYSDDPAGVARSFERAGARRIHIVDLDGAFSGKSANLEAVRAIRGATSVRLELGGGLRGGGDVARIMSLGIDYAILGTSAIADPDLLAALAKRWGERLIAGIDARDGRVAVEGWVKTSDLDAIEFARRLENLGVATVIFTDIATDGVMAGPNLAAVARMADAVRMRIVASGGVRSLADLEALRDLNRPNLLGAIIGRAIYEKQIDLSEAVARLAPNAATPPMPAPPPSQS